MKIMKNNCPKACGECCKVLIFERKYASLTKKQQWKIENYVGYKWLNKHLKRISIKKAKQLNPNIINIDLTNCEFFICDYFNYKNNLCMNYNDRISMCTYYPFYDNIVLDANLFKHTPSCYYINQIMRRS